ncbi:hypothetical protein B9Z65_1655 [Elsinoe australis]|uniref:RNI-like protein n=1 Tax=Elsinoe australis TaxID=40998 RepID=A0A2P7YGI0_9PEZI|nr:hypothetical protein B9Z65_1655 [Elsinoe australis]
MKQPLFPFPSAAASPAQVEEYLDTATRLFKSQQCLYDEANKLSPQKVVDGLQQRKIYLDARILNLPRRQSAHSQLAHTLAERIYPDLADHHPSAAIIRYDNDVLALRRAVREHRERDAADAKEAKEAKKVKDWSLRVLTQGPWDEPHDAVSYKGAPALPMPVDLSDMQSLIPFFNHLSHDGTDQDLLPGGQEGQEPLYGVHLLEYEKGVLYSDGRLDLCKKVVGPHNIAALMTALRTNTFTRHFLLGNNVIGPAGARAIADFVKDFPERMETWYLAGNCIDAESLRSLVNAWVNSSTVTNIWLKRNPLGPTAADDLFRLITQAPNLRTLDLDQTELGDGGVARLFELLADHIPDHDKLPLKHIYLNACGLGPKSMASISAYLSQPNCSLESLYMSLNPIGSSLPLLTPGLTLNTSLERLTLASTGVTDTATLPLLTALSPHPTLRVLDLGRAYATPDLSQRYNYLTDALTEPLCAFLRSNPSLLYLALHETALTPFGPSFLPSSLQRTTNPRPPSFDAASNLSGLAALYHEVATHPSLVYFSAKSIFPLHVCGQDRKEYGWLAKIVRGCARERLEANVRSKYGVDYGTFLAKEKRFVVSPRYVRFIDSVYRNRDAGAARRGEKRLEKWWGDEGVLEEVRMAGLQHGVQEGA